MWSLNVVVTPKAVKQQCWIVDKYWQAEWCLEPQRCEETERLDLRKYVVVEFYVCEGDQILKQQWRWVFPLQRNIYIHSSFSVLPKEMDTL